MSADRALISTTRRIADGSRDAYRVAWEGLAAAVRETGAHAWRFRSASDPELHIEFLEFRGGNDPRSRPAVATALEAVDALQSGSTDEWLPPEEHT